MRACVVWILSALACGDTTQGVDAAVEASVEAEAGDAAVATRAYRMAMTPFPYNNDFSQSTLDYVYSKLDPSVDMIAEHMDGGVPWLEASTDAFPYNANLMTDWNTRKAYIQPGQKVYVAVSPINFTRNGVAAMWTAAGKNQPLTAPWNGYAFDTPDVELAYLNYCRRVIAFFNPDFLTIGIESNMLMAGNKSLWAGYVTLQKNVYQSLKTIYPNLPIMVSIEANETLGYVAANTADQTQARADLAPYSDDFCLSLYPYQGTNAATDPPADMFDRLAQLTTKPMAICETGYPSHDATASFGTITGTPARQDAYFASLFAAADKYRFPFVVEFFLRDLDDALGAGDVVMLFKYDGLLDTSGSPKPAYATWMSKLGAVFQP